MEIGAIDHPLVRHFLQHLEQIAPVIGSHYNHGKVFDFAGLDQGDRFKQLVERSSAALHHDKSVRVFYQQRFADEKVVKRDAAIEKGVRLLLELELDVATDRASVDIFCSAIGRFHNTRPATGHDGESELGNSRTHFARQLITGMTLFYSSGTEDSHAWSHKMEHAKSA